MAKYFSISELCRSRDYPNIPNTPGAKEKANLENLIRNILDPLRESIGHPITVNSGYRGPALNRAVGGSVTSAHMSGNAADIICPRYGNAKKFCQYIEKWLKDNNVKFDQLIYEYGSWVHIGIKNNSGVQRGQVITINRRGTHQGIVD